MRLKILAVGTGRDGTVTVREYLQQLFDIAGNGWNACHEYMAIESYNAYADFRENGDSTALQELRRSFAECPHDAIVGNGYAFYLTALEDIFEDNVKLLHIQRRNRDACIQSLIANCDMFPRYHENYSSRTDVEYACRRVTAFHLEEMTRREWEQLSITEKFGWYYDKTHELISLGGAKFNEYLHIYTEDLSDPSTIRSIAGFVGVEGDRFPAPLHLNSYVYADALRVAPMYREKAQWLFGRLDCSRSVEDDLYPMEYFTERLVEWIELRISQLVPDRRDQIADVIESIDRAVELFQDGTQRINELRSLILNRFAPGPEGP